ncbi:unnamed protein product [Cunninghamella blakesleeana]
MNIRTYRDSDWDRISVIHDEARKIELEANDLMDAYLTLDQTYKNEDLFSYDLLVAENEEHVVVGFIAFEESEIAWLYVDPIFHRQGIASVLLKEAMDKCGDTIYVEVLHKNKAAISFYQRMGFKIKEEASGKMPGNEKFHVTCCILEYNK